MNDGPNIHELSALPENGETLIRASAINRYTGIARQTHTRWRHEGVGPMYLVERSGLTAGATAQPAFEYVLLLENIDWP